MRQDRPSRSPTRSCRCSTRATRRRSRSSAGARPRRPAQPERARRRRDLHQGHDQRAAHDRRRGRPQRLHRHHGRRRPDDGGVLQDRRRAGRARSRCSGRSPAPSTSRCTSAPTDRRRRPHPADPGRATASRASSLNGQFLLELNTFPRAGRSRRSRSRREDGRSSTGSSATPPGNLVVTRDHQPRRRIPLQADHGRPLVVGDTLDDRGRRAVPRRARRDQRRHRADGQRQAVRSTRSAA